MYVSMCLYYIPLSYITMLQAAKKIVQTDRRTDRQGETYTSLKLQLWGIQLPYSSLYSTHFFSTLSQEEGAL